MATTDTALENLQQAIVNAASKGPFALDAAFLEAAWPIRTSGARKIRRHHRPASRSTRRSCWSAARQPTWAP